MRPRGGVWAPPVVLGLIVGVLAARWAIQGASVLPAGPTTISLLTSWGSMFDPFCIEKRVFWVFVFGGVLWRFPEASGRDFGTIVGSPRPLVCTFFVASKIGD